MLSRDVVQYIDYGVLGVIGFFVLVCLFGLLSTVLLPACRLPRGTKAFYRTWPGRLVLSLLGAGLLASQVFRMSSVWGLTGSSQLTSPSSEGVLCRVYITLCPGLLQPWFLCTALLLCRFSMSSRVEKAGSGYSVRLVSLALLLAAPFCAVQTVIAWLSKIFHSAGWDEDRGSVGHYFFSTFDVGQGQQCASDQEEDGCVLCIFPAASTIVTGVFTIAYSLALFRYTSDMARRTINRRLRLRLTVMQLTMLGSLSTQVIMASVSVVSPPWTWLFEVCWLVYAASLCVLVFTVVWILVVSPVWGVYGAQRSLVKGGPSEVGSNGGGGGPPLPPLHVGVSAVGGTAVGGGGSARGEQELSQFAKGAAEKVLLTV